eukprot:scaffold133_cov257-Pinguiococcus_pyrenoidosus.AAC.1
MQRTRDDLGGLDPPKKCAKSGFADLTPTEMHNLLYPRTALSQRLHVENSFTRRFAARRTMRILRRSRHSRRLLRQQPWLLPIVAFRLSAVAIQVDVRTVQAGTNLDSDIHRRFRPAFAAFWPGDACEGVREAHGERREAAGARQSRSSRSWRGFKPSMDLTITSTTA